MKNIAVTVIVGFVTGLIISGILFDVINYFGKSFNRVSVSWNISKAEKAYSEGRFSDSVSIYKKTLSKIGADNKLLTAKTKNNTALSIIKKIETENNVSVTDYKKENSYELSSDVAAQLDDALSLLNEAKDLFLEINEQESYLQTSENIKILETFKNDNL